MDVAGPSAVSSRAYDRSALYLILNAIVGLLLLAAVTLLIRGVAFLVGIALTPTPRASYRELLLPSGARVRVPIQ